MVGDLVLSVCLEKVRRGNRPFPNFKEHKRTGDLEGVWVDGRIQTTGMRGRERAGITISGRRM